MPGTLDVHVADPDQLSRGIAVAYRFTNQGQADCRQRVAVGELGIDPPSYRGYDASGLPVAQNGFQIIPFDLQ